MILLSSLFFSLCLMLVAWGIYLITKNPALIDIFWGLNICAMGLIYLFMRDTNTLTWIAAALLVVWGMRLSLFLLFTRGLKGHRDARYEALASDWKQKALGFLGQYMLQGLLAWVIALPFFTLQYIQNINAIAYLSVILILTGIIGESLADYQLHIHKQHGKKEVLKQGLWHYSRHPNYFFECMIWLGFSLMGASLGLGLISLLSITTLFCIMWFGTIPMTEAQSLKQRKDYQAYMESTSCFMPWCAKPRTKS
tara:strand:+ start:64764 stop:65522 length:759 start_codon:yes stop_codon:yes gene_type:complete